MSEFPRYNFKLKEFSAGEWNVNGGGSRFTAGTRKPIDLARKLPLIREAGAKWLEFHDTELPAEEAKEFKKVIDGEGMKTGMVTANLFRRAEFIHGAYDSPDPKTRRMAIDLTKKYLEMGINVLGAQVYVYWVGTAGFDMEFAKDHVKHLGYIVAALNEVVGWALEQFGEEKMIPICFEPKPNEPRRWMYGGTVGDALALIYAMDPKYAKYVGLNPETAHSKMAGLNYNLDLSQGLLHGKLWHVHLNDQSGPAFDQDYAFGDCDLMGAFATVYTLKKHKYKGLVGVDVQPLGTDREDQYAVTIKRSLDTFRRLLKCCDRIHDKDLEALQKKSDQAGIMELIRDAMLAV